MSGSGLGIVGESPAIVKVREEVEVAAACDEPVMIIGETGVGKDLVAKTIHLLSRRAHRPFRVVLTHRNNELFRAEVFGHVKGAFTGALEASPGILASAEGGTVFFNEITQIPDNILAPLNTFLDYKRYTPVGGTEEREADVRILAATNKDPRSSEFMDNQVYQRLRVIRIMLPPLRERLEDIPLLLDHFIERYCAEHDLPRPRVDPGTVRSLQEQQWRGNVRELWVKLKNALIRRPDSLHMEYFQDSVAAQAVAPSWEERPLSLKDAVADFEARYIQEVVDRMGGSLERAARLLEVSERTIKRKLGITR